MLINMIRILGVGLALAVIALLGFLLVSPPDLLRVATNYSAKIVCSNVFIAGRDADEVLTVDVQAPGHPLLRFMSIDVDEASETVTARIFWIIAEATSRHRRGLGCTNTHTAELSDATLEVADVPQTDGLWPEGSSVNLSQDPELIEVLSDQSLLGPGFRALVVVRNGRIIAERYADGFNEATPMLGWSMAKTVTAGLIGTLIESGQVKLDDPLTDAYPDWAVDDRKSITVRSMLAMSSGLQWNEGYGDVSDVTRMLFLSDDMTAFASGFGMEAEPGATFNYSSGTSTMLARFWQNEVGADSLEYPQKALFGPLGMTSTVMETDAKDRFVGSSYMYATARDWARFGQFLLQKGEWNGQQILPYWFFDWMTEPAAASEGRYTKGHMWLEVPGEQPPLEDAVWLAGHDGQSVAIIPSKDMVIVRLGLTPSKLGYSPRALAGSLMRAVGE